MKHIQSAKSLAKEICFKMATNGKYSTIIYALRYMIWSLRCDKINPRCEKARDYLTRTLLAFSYETCTQWSFTCHRCEEGFDPFPSMYYLDPRRDIDFFLDVCDAGKNLAPFALCKTCESQTPLES